MKLLKCTIILLVVLCGCENMAQMDNELEDFDYIKCADWCVSRGYLTGICPARCQAREELRVISEGRTK